MQWSVYFNGICVGMVPANDESEARLVALGQYPHTVLDTLEVIAQSIPEDYENDKTLRY